MPYTSGHEVDLFYESFGGDDDPTLLLIAGHGVQLLGWPDELCWSFVDRGFRVVRFDNRDAGRSTVMSNDTLYGLPDMAADALAVLDAVGAESAHVVGMSMGGMIAQVLACDHSHRVMSLTSISATTGEEGVGRPSPEALNHMVVEQPSDREGNVAHALAGRRVWGSTRWFDEELSRIEYEQAFDRAFHPGAGARQAHALLSAGDRAHALARIEIPTLVIHADVDPLIDRSGGERTAELVPGAELVIIDDMGHQLPAPVWSQLVEAVTQVAVRAMNDRR